MSIELVETIQALEKVGFKREQAEEQVRAMTKFTKDQATKFDVDRVEKNITATRIELKIDINRLDNNIKETRIELKTDIKNVEQKIADTRVELKADIDRLDQNIKDTKTELKTDIKNLDQKITDTRVELKADIDRLDQNIKETRAEIKEIRVELKADINRLDQNIKDLRVEIKNDLKDFATKEEMNLRFNQVYTKIDTLLTTKTAATMFTVASTFLALVLAALELREEIVMLFR